MGQILFFVGLGVGVIGSFSEGQNIFRALLNGFIFAGLFWGIGWWINSWKNSL